MTPMNTSLGRRKNRSQFAHFLRLPDRWSVHTGDFIGDAPVAPPTIESANEVIKRW
jgi:hypothetical protein